MALSISPSFYQHQSLKLFGLLFPYRISYFPQTSPSGRVTQKLCPKTIDSHTSLLGLPDLASKHTGCPVVLELQMNKEIFHAKSTPKYLLFQFKFKWFKYNPVTLQWSDQVRTKMLLSTAPAESPAEASTNAHPRE